MRYLGFLLVSISMVSRSCCAFRSPLSLFSRAPPSPSRRRLGREEEDTAHITPLTNGQRDSATSFLETFWADSTLGPQSGPCRGFTVRRLLPRFCALREGNPAQARLPTRQPSSRSTLFILRVAANSDSGTTTSLGTSSGEQKFAFESNVARVMDIIIHSLYSNRDVFFRELISNAADACDKKRFLYLNNSKSLPERLGIRVSANRTANTITVEDTGVGMSRAELVQNLGRIAESGTKLFREQVKSNAGQGNEEAAQNLIGQFGVGFYSVFLVADSVTVVTKKDGGEQLRWKADARNLDVYSISRDETEQIAATSGTRIELALKEDCDHYLDEAALRALIEKYSEFIQFPIELLVNTTRPESINDTTDVSEQAAKSTNRAVMKSVLEWQTVNTKKPLWLRSPKDCSRSEYDDFYKQTFKTYDKPLAYSHFSVEGNVDFKALLFLPDDIPFELSRDMFSDSARCMRLYVNRVFINDKFEDLLPRWLIFIRGVVDSDDLPLNVGREILQNSRSLRLVKHRLVKKSLDMMADLLNQNRTSYLEFWRKFGKYVKVGTIEEEPFRPTLVSLCMFHTSNRNSSSNSSTRASTSITLSSLPEYISRMPEDQRAIYYVTGDTISQAAASPLLERLRRKNYEVIYVSEPVDEMTLQSIERYGDYPIVDVGKESTGDLTEAERREKQLSNDHLQAFRDWMCTILSGKVMKVEVSTHLIDSPAVVVQSEHGLSPSMQKYIRQQTTASMDAPEDANELGTTGSNFPDIFNQVILEINPIHPVITCLQDIFARNSTSEKGRELVELTFETAKLSAGYSLGNAAGYARSVTNVMTEIALAQGSE